MQIKTLLLKVLTELGVPKEALKFLQKEISRWKIGVADGTGIHMLLLVSCS
jgi:hypothetical protein